MLELHILEQFVTFYHVGTLVETAEQLHISQSTLTRGMQRLEEEFGVPLFVRTKNSISFTEAGKMAASDAEMVLRQCDNMLYRVRDFDRKSRTVTVGSCAPVPAAEVLSRLTSLFSGAAVSSELKGIGDLCSGLDDDTYQLVILPYPPGEMDVISVPLCTEHLFFYLPENHRFAGRESLTVSEMNGENMLLFQDIGFWHDLVIEKMPDSRFLLQSERYSFLELVRNSTMPSFTTDAAQYGQPEGGRVRVPIEDEQFNVTYHLVCKKENKNKFRLLFDAVRAAM